MNAVDEKKRSDPRMTTSQGTRRRAYDGFDGESTATIKMRSRVASFKNAPEFLSRCLTKMFLSRL